MPGVPDTHLCKTHRGCDYDEADHALLLQHCAGCKKRKYADSDLGKAAQKKYKDSALGKAANRKYHDSDLGKATNRKYHDSDHGKATRRKYRNNRLLAQLQDKPNLFLAIANADLETKKNFVSAVKQLNVDEDITVLLDDAIDQIDNSAAWDTEYPNPDQASEIGVASIRDGLEHKVSAVGSAALVGNVPVAVQMYQLLHGTAVGLVHHPYGDGSKSAVVHDLDDAQDKDSIFLLRFFEMSGVAKPKIGKV